jgi:hypothetical protein
MGAFDTLGNWDHHIFSLASGVVQLYVRDPARNLIEVVFHSVDALPADIAAVVESRAAKHPQTEESARATFFTK